MAQVIQLPHQHRDTYPFSASVILLESFGTCRGGIKIFKALARLASNSKFVLAKSEKNSLISCLC
jgi:hypothetical protein